MHNINKCLAKLFADLDEESREVCVYGLELLLLTVGDLVVLLTAAIILGKLSEGILFLIVYSSIRSQSGGYHADSKLGCLGIFLVIFLISLFSAEFIQNMPAVIFCIICAAVWGTVFGLAPVEAVGIPIQEKKKKIMKRRALAIMSLCMACGCVLYFLDTRYYIYIVLAMLCNTLVLIAGKIKLILRR